MLLKLLITCLNYLLPSLTLCSCFASISSSWRVYRKVLTLMCSWSIFLRMGCGAWWILINVLPFLPSIWRVMQSRIVIPRPPSSPWLLRRCMASQMMHGYLDKDPKQFRMYFLALFAEKEYTQVLDHISQVDKSLRAALSFLQVALPGGLSDPVLLYAMWYSRPHFV